MVKVSKRDEYINEEFNNFVKDVELLIEKNKLLVKAEEEELINMNDIDTNLKSRMKEFKKLVKEAKTANNTTSNSLRDYHSELMRCQDLYKQTEIEEVDQKVNTMLHEITLEIDNTCKSVFL